MTLFGAGLGLLLTLVFFGSRTWFRERQLCVGAHCVLATDYEGLVLASDEGPFVDGRCDGRRLQMEHGTARIELDVDGDGAFDCRNDGCPDAASPRAPPCLFRRVGDRWVADDVAVRLCLSPCGKPNGAVADIGRPNIPNLAVETEGGELLAQVLPAASSCRGVTALNCDCVMFFIPSPDAGYSASEHLRAYGHREAGEMSLSLRAEHGEDVVEIVPKGRGLATLEARFNNGGRGELRRVGVDGGLETLAYVRWVEP